MQAKFYFSNSTYITDIVLDSFSASEIYYNKLQPADSSLSFTIPFSTEFCNKINADINNDVKVEIKCDDGETNYITAYVKKEIGLEQKYRNQPISISAVNPSYLLDQTISESYALEGKTVAWILEWLLEKAGFTDIGTLNIDTVIPLFIINSGDNLKDVIKELCFEYSKTFYFDNNGYFQVYDLFTAWSDNSQIFSKDNVYGEIDVTSKEHDADCVRGTWTPVELVEDTLVFKDTQNATDTDDCRIAIEAHKYYADKEDNLLDCDSTLGEVKYVKAITQANVEHDTGITVTTDLEDRQSLSQIHFKALNENENTSYITKMEFYADAYISEGERTEVTSYGKKEKELTLKYIQDETVAQTFVKNVADYYNYANFTISLKSKENWALGSSCKVVAEGIGSFNCRILKKTTTLKSDIIKYELENIGYYLPAEIVQSTGTNQSKNMAGSNQGTAGANGYNCFTIELFKRWSSVPAVPNSTLTYDFTTGELSGDLNGWSRSIPEIDENNNPCYLIQYNIATVALSKDIAPADWGTPVQVLKDSNLTLADVQELISQSVPPPTVYINPTFAGFAVDSKSVATVDQEIECEVKVLQTGDEMSFTFGTVDLPEGFSYTIDGSKIKFSVAAGTVIKYGSITIPVIFKAYKAAVAYQNGSNYLYVSSGTILGNYDDVETVEALTPNEDEIINWIGETTAASETLVDGGTFKANTAYYYTDGIWKVFDFAPYGYFTYEDEDTVYNIGLGYTQVKGGRYLGTIESASDIPENVILGDYFTYTGINTDDFKKSCVYIYNGTQWAEDTNTDHNSLAFYDVLGVAEEELSENNTTVNQMLNHLTANEIFVQRIVANNAFIQRLMADEALINTIKANSVQTNQLIVGNITGLQDDLDSKADVKDAIVSQKQVYYLGSTKPSKPTSEVTSTSTASEIWTTQVPSIVLGKTYYSCTQSYYADGSIGWGTVADDAVLNSEISALNSANSASSSASSASTSASSANEAANSASSSASAASSSANSASSSAASASTYADNASTSADSASSSASDAASSASSASTSADNAASSATSAGNSATSASSSASSASSSASAASSSATDAASSATSAGNSATSAENSATAAGKSATSASSSASSASSSASSASSSASSASSSASSASKSASSASSSASSASDSAGEAASSASSASTSAGNAASSATSAGNSASAASRSAKSASSSAESASGSATAAGNSASAAETAQGKAEDAQSKAETAQAKAETAATNAKTAATNAKTAATNTIIATRLVYYRSTITTVPSKPASQSAIVDTDTSDVWTYTVPSFATVDGTDEGNECYYFQVTEFKKHDYSTDQDYYTYSDVSSAAEIERFYYSTRGQTIIKGRYLNTGLIEANSIKAEKIDVTDLLATDITVKDKLTSEAVDDDGNPVFEIDGTTGKATFNDVEVSGIVKGKDGYFTGVLGKVTHIASNIDTRTEQTLMILDRYTTSVKNNMLKHYRIYMYTSNIERYSFTTDSVLLADIYLMTYQYDYRSDFWFVYEKKIDVNASVNNFLTLKIKKTVIIDSESMTKNCYDSLSIIIKSDYSSELDQSLSNIYIHEETLVEGE